MYESVKRSIEYHCKSITDNYKEQEDKASECINNLKEEFENVLHKKETAND